MNQDEFDELRAEVYGESYTEAQHQMDLLTEQLKLQTGIGFKTGQECSQWADEHLLSIVAFSPSAKTFYYVSHKGELLREDAFRTYYGSILFYLLQNASGTFQERVWTPETFTYFDRARIAGELSDGTHDPLYYRDYARPTGYYNAVRGRFNLAKPFPFYARETGRDTTHIYTLIEHVAGECAMWLLAWLRAKLLHPTQKTQVVPIIVSRAQGSGKSTFGEVICKGLFGKDNVLVTDQYDSQARFNSDYADALIVCMEEKEETDRRNPVASIKSRATATTIRKELKGIDPVYQESYTDFLMTTNKDVPIKFEGREDQRRFMIMQADENFTRKTSELADEVFSKLYGYDANGNHVGTPFTEDRELVEQFKHELFSREDIASIELRNFPKTAAYKRCFTLPRTSESTEVESILRALAPYMVETLRAKHPVTDIPPMGSVDSIIQYPGAMQYVSARGTVPGFVALCRPLVFYDLQTSKPYAHATVERGLLDCVPWLREEFKLELLPETDPLFGGFEKIAGRYRAAPTARFALLADLETPSTLIDTTPEKKPEQKEEAPAREGERLRVDATFRPNKRGCFETVNEMKPGVKSLKNKTENVQYMDTLLFESDDCTGVQYELEKERAEKWKLGSEEAIPALALYKERLQVQKSEAMRLFDEGVACRVVYSGAKSYHILVRVADAPKTPEEYSWLHAHLCNVLSDKIVFDVSTSDPARLTRSPVEQPRVTYNSKYNIQVAGVQQLICEDFKHVYRLRWRDLYEQWSARPLRSYEKHGRRLVPTKPEYREAMEALLEGTYWTDDKWSGRRQQTFFPAYRLLRSLGYTHDELWTDDLLLKNLEQYYDQHDIFYWRSRADSGIIAQIDGDFDNEH